MRNVLITGGSRGIGAALVKAFSRNGDRVVFTYKNSKDEADKISEMTYSKAICCDLNNSQESIIAIERAMKEEHIDGFQVLVLNGAVSHMGLFDMMHFQEIEDIMRTDLLSYIHIAKHFGSKMMWDKRGSIIFLSSMWGQFGASCEVVYSAAKSGIDGLTKSLAKEWGPSGIRVNAISPGVVKTQMNSHLSEHDEEALLEQIPLSRFAEPEEIAEVALFLASDKSSYITGQIIGVNGGIF